MPEGIGGGKAKRARCPMDVLQAAIRVLQASDPSFSEAGACWTDYATEIYRRGEEALSSSIR